mgnify:CR=1 FL=1
MKHLNVRLPMYFIGLFVMTVGIALSVKSNLGVSPVSSIPYTITCVWGLEMGKATILFHITLVLIQLLLLRKNFKPVQLLQIPVGIVFGYFTTFCNYMVSFLSSPDNMLIRIIMLFASTLFIAKVKISFDCAMVLVSALTCLAILHSLGSVGIGTIIAAVLVGTLVGLINRAFAKQRDQLLGKTTETVSPVTEATSHYIHRNCA